MSCRTARAASEGTGGAREGGSVVREDARIGGPALFDRSYFKELSELSSDKGARKLITENLNKVTAIPGEGKLKDIDTREAYEALYRATHQ